MKQLGPNLLDALTAIDVLPLRERNALAAWASSFYGFQRDWLFDPARFAACLKSRQIGISHSSAAAAVVWGAFLGETTTIVSLGQREADEVAEKAALHAKVLESLGSRWAKHRANKSEVRFANGGRIIALPSSSGGRGFSGNIFLDEYAYHEHASKIWDGASATVMHGYRLRVASTPNGVGNAFHSFWTSDTTVSGFSQHEISLKLAVAQGMKVDLADCWKIAKGDPRVFAQLFECSFLDGDLQYIPTSLVNDAKIDPTQMPRLDGHVYAGLDIGLENDLTALTLLREDRNGVLWEQDTTTCKRTAWADQETLISQSYGDWRWRRLSLDATGLGMVPAQRLQQTYGERVEPVMFTLQSKEALATGLYQALAEQRLVIRDDPDMIRDICSLRRIVTSSGNVRYDAPRTVHGHADRAWSLALAVYAASPFVKGRAGGAHEVTDLGTNI